MSLCFPRTQNRDRGHPATTGYILLAIQFEEHDLIRAHGEKYQSYRGRTSMLLPMMRRSKG